MADGGLSAEAIERCIVGWAGETQDGDEIPAARAELAALQAAAERAGALAAALADLLNGGRWSDGYGARKFAMRLTGDEHAALHDLLAEAGPGAAGARDETAAVIAAAAVLLAIVNRGHRIRCPRYTASREHAACTCGVDTVGDALDALRAGGAGEGETTDG